MMLFHLLLFAAVTAINEFCPSIKKSPFLRRDLAKSFNALFRQIESPNLPCIPELTDLNCEEIKSITNKKGRRRNIQKCFAQALSHKKYIGNFKTGEHCFLFFKIRVFIRKNGVRRSKLLTKNLKNRCRVKQTAQPATWTDWTAWSSCSKSCGSGTRLRTRICVEGRCFGNKEEGEICNKEECPSENSAQFWNAQNSESKNFDFISWPNVPKDCKFFEFRDYRGRKLTKNECLAVLDRSANRLYPLNTKECLEKNFYLKDGRQLSSSECIEIVDKREMFIIKSARRILSRDPETKEECLTSDFFYNGNYLSIFECEERFESLKTAAPEIEEDFGIGPRHRQDCEDYEFFVDDKPLSIEECLQLLR